MVKVYIASPYTKGDVAQNVKTSIDCADELMNEGLVPYCPLLTHFQHMVHPRSYEDWMLLDIEWLKSCDCLLRLQGESEGADKEVECATKNNLPVFYSLEDLKTFYKYFHCLEDLFKFGKIWEDSTYGTTISFTMDMLNLFEDNYGESFIDIWNSLSKNVQKEYIKVFSNVAVLDEF